MQPQAELRAQLRVFIANELLTQDETLADDTELLISGLLDSIAVTELLDFIESSARVTIPATDLIAENFGSIDAILRYLAAATQQ